MVYFGYLFTFNVLRLVSFPWLVRPVFWFLGTADSLLMLCRYPVGGGCVQLGKSASVLVLFYFEGGI